MTAAEAQIIAGIIGGALASQLGPATDLPGDGAIPVVSGTYRISKAGVAALTIAAPVAADVGKRLTITSITANAHVITFTGNTLRGGTAAVATATAAAQKGAGLSLECVNAGEWNVVANVAMTLA
jgi:hypothetical protein